MPPLTDRLLKGTFTVEPGLFTIIAGLKADLRRISFTCAAERVGKYENNKAAIPDTQGADILEPDLKS